MSGMYIKLEIMKVLPERLKGIRSATLFNLNFNYFLVSKHNNNETTNISGSWCGVKRVLWILKRFYSSMNQNYLMAHKEFSYFLLNINVRQIAAHYNKSWYFKGMYTYIVTNVCSMGLHV